jgi:very-short-patch-repair endonuclease
MKKRYYFNNKRVSKGEKQILLYLTKYNINYIKEKFFNNCLSPKGNKLRFDFYLPDYNLLIEFDGQHHYKPVNKYNRAKRTHKQTVINDQIKNQFVLDNNINLLRIPYNFIDSVDNILTEHINYYHYFYYPNKQ